MWDRRKDEIEFQETKTHSFFWKHKGKIGVGETNKKKAPKKDLILKQSIKKY